MSSGTRELLTKLGFSLDRKGLDEAKKAVGETMEQVKKNSEALETLSTRFSRFAAILTNPWTIGIGALVGGVGAMTEFAEKASEANRQLELLAMKTGMTKDQLYGLKIQSAGVGIPFETLNIALGRMTYNIRQNQKQFAQFGISAAQPADALVKIVARFNDIQDPAERAKIGMLAFGRQWQELVPLLASGADSIRNALTSAHLDPKILENYEKIHKGNIQISMAWAGIRKALGDIASGPLAAYTEKLAESAKKLKDWINDFSKQAIDALRSLNDALTSSGFYEALKQIQALWNNFLEALKQATGQGWDLASVLQTIAVFASNIAWTLAIVVAASLKFVGLVLRMTQILGGMWNILKSIALYMGIIYGAPMILRMALVSAEFIRQIALQTALNFQFLIANIRMAAQGGILSILSLGWSLLSGAIGRGVGMMRLFGAASMTTFGAIGAALAVLYWSYTRIMDALEERSKRIQKEQNDAARGQVEDELQKRTEAVNAAKRDKKSTAEIAALEKHRKVLADQYKKDWTGNQADPSEAPANMDFSVIAKTYDSNMEANMEKHVQTNSRQTTINNKLNFGVTVQPGKEGNTGLSADQVNKVAMNAAHSVISMQLAELVNSTL